MFHVGILMISGSERMAAAAATAGGVVAIEEQLFHRLNAGDALAALLALLGLIIIDRGDEMYLGVGVDDADLDFAVVGHRLGELVQDFQTCLLRDGLLLLLFLHLDSFHNLAHVDRSFLCVDLNVVKP